MAEKITALLSALLAKLTNAQTVILILVLALCYVTVGGMTENPRDRAARNAVATDSVAEVTALRTELSLMRVEINTKLDALDNRVGRIEKNIDDSNNYRKH